MKTMIPTFEEFKYNNISKSSKDIDFLELVNNLELEYPDLIFNYSQKDKDMFRCQLITPSDTISIRGTISAKDMYTFYINTINGLTN